MTLHHGRGLFEKQPARTELQSVSCFGVPSVRKTVLTLVLPGALSTWTSYQVSLMQTFPKLPLFLTGKVRKSHFRYSVYCSNTFRTDEKSPMQKEPF